MLNECIWHILKPKILHTENFIKHPKQAHLVFFAFIFFIFMSEGISARSETSADKVFSVLQNITFQIRIIEEKSGSRIALGTGFLVAPDRIASNYHVVANNVLEPEKYRIEIEYLKTVYQLKVLTVDVVHDLSVLQIQEATFQNPFVLSTKAPKNGETLYSLGNPLDLGLTIVEGNYNGLVENKFIDQIHFSGAINSGMSGGPAVNGKFEVVGINVATGGNQVGFLVPVKYLAKLLNASQNLGSDYDVLADMSEQIISSTRSMIEELLVSEWPQERMGSAIVPGNKVIWLTCWGNSQDDKEKGLLNISRGCNNGDNIFINDHFTSGFLEYEYSFFEAEKWPSAAFYQYIRSATSSARPGNRANKEDVENYQCVDKIVASPGRELSKEIGDLTKKVSFCSRPYKRLKGLYDVFYLGVTVDKDNKAMFEHFTISGVDKPSSMLFLKKFMAVLAWE